jgi:nucleoside phosphorylase
MPAPILAPKDEDFYGDPEDPQWLVSAKKKILSHVAKRAKQPPLVTTGAIASSDRLIKEAETLSVWLKFARQIIAVEMESASIYKATHARRVPFLAIRGISDVVGLHRDSSWVPYACETAAAFAKAFLLTRPLK